MSDPEGFNPKTWLKLLEYVEECGVDGRMETSAAIENLINYEKLHNLSDIDSLEKCLRMIIAGQKITVEAENDLLLSEGRAGENYYEN